MTSKSSKSNVKFLEVLQPQAGQSFDRHIVSAAAIKINKSMGMEYLQMFSPALKIQRIIYPFLFRLNQAQHFRVPNDQPAIRDRVL